MEPASGVASSSARLAVAATAVAMVVQPALADVASAATPVPQPVKALPAA